MLRRLLNLEVLVWAGGLLALGLTDPTHGGHFSLCVFKWLGITFCPGCGLGHSVAFFLRGDLAGALHAHPLGPVAVLILSARLVTLLREDAPAFIEHSQITSTHGEHHTRAAGSGRR